MFILHMRKVDKTIERMQFYMTVYINLSLNSLAPVLL